MNSGNMSAWDADQLFAKIKTIRDQVRMRGENGSDAGKTRDLAIDCFALTRELAEAWLPLCQDHQKIHLKYALVDIVLCLAPAIDARLPARKEMIDQGFAWLNYGERFNYDELKKGSRLYYWLRREDPSVVKSYYQSRYDKESWSTSPYSDAELDAFYEQNTQLVHQTMMREVYPDHGIFFEDPLRHISAARFYEYCEKLLAIGYGEHEVSGAGPTGLNME